MSADGRSTKEVDATESSEDRARPDRPSRSGPCTHALNRPSAAGRNRPLYPLNLVDALRGDSLEDAVRDRIVLITGASSGIGATTAKKIGEAGGEVVLVARGREKLEETAARSRPPAARAHVVPVRPHRPRRDRRDGRRTCEPISAASTSSSTTPGAPSAGRSSSPTTGCTTTSARCS